MTTLSSSQYKNTKFVSLEHIIGETNKSETTVGDTAVLGATIIEQG